MKEVTSFSWQKKEFLPLPALVESQTYFRAGMGEDCTGKHFVVFNLTSQFQYLHFLSFKFVNPSYILLTAPV